MVIAGADRTSSRAPLARSPVPSPSIGAMAAAAFDRTTMLERLRDEEFDVLVVGGGITGAGVALDAATRGLRTALVERDDFASGHLVEELQAHPRRSAVPPER